MKLVPCAAIVCLILVGHSIFHAQESATSRVQQEFQKAVTPTNCEYNVSILTAAHQEASDDGLIRIVARLGNKEQRRDLNRRRLHNVRTFLTEFGGRSPQSIIVDEGERVNGYAQVNLYIRGSLFHTFTVRRNDDFRVGVCIYEEQEGPCADERQRKLYPCLDIKSECRQGKSK